MALVAWPLAGMSAQARSLVPPDGQSKHVRDAAGIGRLQRHVSELLSPPNDDKATAAVAK
nr:hypothetical protein [uncultured Rhodopila sp.]